MKPAPTPPPPPPRVTFNKDGSVKRGKLTIILVATNGQEFEFKK